MIERGVGLDVLEGVAAICRDLDSLVLRRWRIAR